MRMLLFLEGGIIKAVPSHRGAPVWKDVFAQAEKGYRQYVRKQYMMISQQRMGRLEKQ